MFPSTKIHDLLAISVIALMTAIPSSMGAFSTVNIRVNNGLTSTWSFKKNHAALKRHLFEDNISRKSRTSSLLITKESSDIEVEEQRSVQKMASSNSASSASGDEDVETASFNTRKAMTAISGIGALETGYLTYVKLFARDGKVSESFCSIVGGIGQQGVESGPSSCGSVLDGPYSSIHLWGDVEVPLVAVGFISYLAATFLSSLPLLQVNDKEELQPSTNQHIDQLALICLTTSMATFSSFLLSLLFGVLHQSCAYCFLSAALSISLGILTWFGGILQPSNDVLNNYQTENALLNNIHRKDAKDNNNNIASTGVKLGLASFASTVVASLAIFLAVDEATIQAYQNDPTQPNAGYASVVANARSSSSSSNKGEEKNNIPPPPITATSSERTLAIASDLQSLDSKMYGAYWCSHCFEQKQRLGKEAMKSITYVECAKEGLNSQRDLCNAKDVPGYPTWEIGGKLYPGEYYLDELEEIIQNTKDRSK